MRLIRAIRISDFRSIATATISDVEDIAPVLGLNGSGKSNLMRALNLFFNGYLEGSVPVSLRRDFREPKNTRKAKLLIAVSIDFDYSVLGALRKDYQTALTLLAGDSDGRISLRREWTLDQVTKSEVMSTFAGATATECQLLDTPERIQAAERLLSLITFRYIPNHVHPSELLSEEHENIRRILQNRLGQKKILEDDVIKSIATTASELMKPVREIMVGATSSSVSDLQLSTPEDWKDLAWGFGLKLRSRQSEAFETVLHGSGVQSFLAYQILHLLDTTFAGSFGWRKGAIWAIEEPESFLHASLQSQLARNLYNFASREPLQIFLSTHSPAFLGLADRSVLATLDDQGRSTFQVVDKTVALETIFSSGIASFGHALHTGAPRPILLVEGKDDKVLLKRAYKEAKSACPYEIRSLEDFDRQFTGGKNEIEAWLKYNKPALQARPLDSPVIVLLDWEVSDGDISSIRNALECHPSSTCVRWPVDLVNPELSERFVGIERCLSTNFIKTFAQAEGLTLTAPAVGAPVWNLDVDRGAMKAKKSRLHRTLDERGDSSDIQPLIDGLSWLNQILANSQALF